MQNRRNHQAKPSEFSDLAFIFKVIIPFFTVFVLCQAWNEAITEDMKLKLLDKYYSQDDIRQKKLKVRQTIYETNFSDGTVLPDEEHKHFRSEQFRKTLPATLLPFLVLFVLSFFLVKKFNPLKKAWADSQKKKH